MASPAPTLINSHMIAIEHRAGRATGLLALGLFMLSALALLPFLRPLLTEEDEGPSIKSEYKFSNANKASQDGVGGNSVNPGPADLEIKAWHFIDGWEQELAQFQTVFWEPDDSNSMRDWLTEGRLKSKSVLEIGTGTGLVSLHCAKQGAKSIVATDINGAAVANAKYNAELQGVTLDVRQVPVDSPGPFSTIASDEKFDLIISNPPWEDAPVEEPAAYALYDPRFALLDGILEQSENHLKKDGSLLLAYGGKEAIFRILEKADGLGWNVEILDQRELAELPDVFLPGMLLVLTRQ